MQNPSSLLSLARRGAPLAFVALTLAACGGGAGDEEPIDNPFSGSSPVERFVGIYDLAGNWNGSDGDQALLEIQTVDEDGEARVLLHDFDEQFNCYFPPQRGTARPNPVDPDGVFMDNVGPFNDAELSLGGGGSLVIDYFEGFGGTSRQRYTAPPVAITATDIVPRC